VVQAAVAAHRLAAGMHLGGGDRQRGGGHCAAFWRGGRATPQPSSTSLVISAVADW
jgi:hypothetical protein